MARAAQGAALVAAVAVLGGLAWWLLGSGDGTSPSSTSPSAAPSPAAAPGGTDGATGPGGKGPARPGPAAATGTLRAEVRGDGQGIFAHLLVEPEDGGPAPAVGAAKHASEGPSAALELGGIPAGRPFTVSVGAGGWTTVRFLGVSLREGEVRDLGPVQLEKALPATGRVLDPAGRPVAGAKVGAVAAGGDFARFDFRSLVEQVFGEPAWLARTTSREDGSFTLDTLGAGRYALTAEAAGFAPAVEEDFLLHPAGTAPPVDLVLGAGHPLLVRVVGPADAPVAGAEVAFAMSSGRSGMPVGPVHSRMATDPAGEARFAGLPEGRAAVAVRTTGDRLVFRSAELPRVAEVTVRLEGGASLLLRVKDGAGAPVEGAAATAFLDVPGTDGGLQTRGKTGADGSVRFERLPAGRVMILYAEKEGFPPASSAGPGGFLNPGVGRDELKEGETLEKEIVLKAGSAVSGVVRRRPGDAPVPGAKVTLLSPGLFLITPARTATADAEGTYRLEGIPEGRAAIYAASADAATPGAWSAATALYPQAQGGSNELSVDVPAGPGEVKRDVFVEDSGAVSGRVLGPSGDPLGGARVEISSRRGFGFFGPAGAGVSPEPVLTAAAGTFSVRGVPAGQDLSARAEAPGLLAGDSPPFHLAAGGEASGIEIRLGEGGTIAGRVSSASGTPLSGARVRASARAPGRPGGMMMDGASGGGLAAVTDGEGNYRIRTVPPGTASVTAAAEGFVEASRGDLAVAAGSETRADFMLEAERVIAGTVRSADGKPVEGARVAARPEARRPESSLRNVSATTDARGAFRIGGLPPGDFVITVSARRQPSLNLPSVASGTESLEVRLPAPAPISGKVVDAAGNPLSGVRVTASPQDGGPSSGWAASGADGTFSIENLGPGAYAVTTFLPDPRYARGEVRGVEGGTANLVLTMSLALSIRGRVLAPDGSPSAARARIRAQDAGGRQVGGTRADGQGSFEIQGLPEGTYAVVATVPGNPAQEGSAPAAAGDAAVEIRLAVTTNPTAPAPAPGRVPAPPTPR